MLDGFPFGWELPLAEAINVYTTCQQEAEACGKQGHSP